MSIVLWIIGIAKSAMLYYINETVKPIVKDACIQILLKRVGL